MWYVTNFLPRSGMSATLRPHEVTKIVMLFGVPGHYAFLQRPTKMAKAMNGKGFSKTKMEGKQGNKNLARKLL